MADILSLPNCGGSTSTFNSGFALCDVIRKSPKALLLLDSGVEFNAGDRASIATFVAAIKTKSRAARGSRVYPLMSLNNFVDNSKAPTKGSTGNLSNADAQLVDAIPSFAFEHRKGDLFHRQLVNAENANLKLMIIDSAYVVYGTITAGGNLTGFSMFEFKAQLPKFANASAFATYEFDVTLDSLTEYKENLGFAQLDSSVLNISGIVDIKTTLSAQVTNVAKIMLTGRGGKNIGTIYPVELAAVGAWKATNAQTGATVTITSVTYDATNGWYVVTTDNTAYGALASGEKFLIDLVSTSALSTLGVDGYESTGGVSIVHI